MHHYDLKVVQLLLERGSNVDAATYTGITPLQVYSHYPSLWSEGSNSIVNFTGGFKEGLHLSG